MSEGWGKGTKANIGGEDASVTPSSKRRQKNQRRHPIPSFVLSPDPCKHTDDTIGYVELGLEQERVRVSWYLSGGARRAISGASSGVHGGPKSASIGHCTCRPEDRADASRRGRNSGSQESLASEA
ncbi:MAG: hypothetical protein Q9181_005118 [Wetmoreana brouardii]